MNSPAIQESQLQEVELQAINAALNRANDQSRALRQRSEMKHKARVVAKRSEPAPADAPPEAPLRKFTAAELLFMEQKKRPQEQARRPEPEPQWDDDLPFAM